MAAIKKRRFLRHLRGTQTSWVRHHVHGRVRHEGVGQSFWYRPLTAVLSEVPVDDRELPLLFHARTRDFTDMTIQATLTYRIADPAVAATRLDFSIDPYRGTWAADPLSQVATLLAELAQQPALDLLAGIPLTEALTAGIAPIREAVGTSLHDDPRLAETGVTVVSVRVVAVRPEPEPERALETPTREAVQVQADRATYARRAQAVEQERAIAENELQNKIELARREQQLVEQHGTNARRRAELDGAAELVAARSSAEREKVAAAAEAENERTLAVARAEGVRAVGVAEGEAEAARLAAYRDLPPAVLRSLAPVRPLHTVHCRWEAGTAVVVGRRHRYRHRGDRLVCLDRAGARHGPRTARRGRAGAVLVRPGGMDVAGHWSVAHRWPVDRRRAPGARVRGGAAGRLR